MFSASFLTLFLIPLDEGLKHAVARHMSNVRFTPKSFDDYTDVVQLA
jgi:hypothetical protein